MRIGEFNVKEGQFYKNISDEVLMGVLPPGGVIEIVNRWEFIRNDNKKQGSNNWEVRYSFSDLQFNKGNFQRVRKQYAKRTTPEVVDINVKDLVEPANMYENITDKDISELIMQGQKQFKKAKGYQIQASKEQIDFIDEVTAKYPVFSTHEVTADNILLNDMRDTFSECLTTAIAKNSDYAGNKNPFGNIVNSQIVGVDPRRAILVRMMDKVSRITTLLDKEAKVKDESIQDTLMDLINYTAILKSYLKNKSLSNEG